MVRGGTQVALINPMDRSFRRGLITFFALFSLVNASAFSYEGSCEKVDFNKDENSPFRKIPVYDQGETGTCYAYAASQMIDYYRLLHGEPATDLTNPVYAAFATNTSGVVNKGRAGADSLYGGFPEDVVAALRQGGSCPSDEVDKNLATFKSDMNVSDAQVLAFLEATYKKASQSPKDSKGRPLFPNPNDALNYAEMAVPSLGICEAEQLAMVSALHGYMGLSAKAVLNDAFQSCKAKMRPVKVPPTVTLEAGSDASIQKSLDHFLGKSPLTIGVCSTFFEQPNYQGLNGLLPPRVRRSVDNVKSDCKGHAVTLTGRRPSGGRCQYLIRNSWGTSWRPSGAAACACTDFDGKYWEECPDSVGVKEYVGCWFDSDAMIRNTTEVTAFE